MKYQLLNIDGNPKTIKGQKQGYMTAILYLSPWKSAGINICPMAELAGCYKGCLNTAGHGGMAKAGATFAPFGVTLPENNVQKARIRRTRFYADDRAGFMAQLVAEIRAFLKKAARKELTPVVRLNGTSDIQFERLPLTVDGTEYASIMDVFSDVQFYDYTKIAKRFERELPANYHLSLSYSEASPVYAERCWKYHREHGASLVMVYRNKAAIERADNFYRESHLNVVDGDAHDLRFVDPARSIVSLKAKGLARKDTSGFVLD